MDMLGFEPERFEPISMVADGNLTGENQPLRKSAGGNLLDLRVRPARPSE